MKLSRNLLAVSVCLALAVASFAQTNAPAAPAAPAPAPTPLTQEERDFALKNLQATHDAFLQSASGVSDRQWKFKAGPDRWSIAEVAEHITIAESTLGGLIETKIMATPLTPEKRAEVKGKDETVLKALTDRSHKAQAPEFLKPTGRWATKDELVKAFEEARKSLMAYVRTTNDDLRDHFAPHPVLGTMDAYQWILLISAHSERHTKQIEEVKTDKNYPKE
jgi:hypothetical protein